VRGIAGFRGAVVLIPILGVFLGPAAVVPILTAVDSVAAAPLLPQACREYDWKEVTHLFAGALQLPPDDVEDGLPAPWNDLERLGDVLAQHRMIGVEHGLNIPCFQRAGNY
jgi:hypothetical protein